MNDFQMRPSILLSIIIPVYNTAPYLEHCFQTVMRCNLCDCEILLSLGQSSDRSEQICRTYARQYSQIKIIQQNGTGLSNARNCALDAASGEYILFLDSDDFVDSGCLDAVLKRLRDGSFSSDVIVTDFRRLEYPANTITNIFQIGEDTPVQYELSFLPKMLRKRQCFWNVWRYIFSFRFLKKNGIRFLENRVSEDVDFITSVFLAEPAVIFSHSPYYVYVVGRGGSLMDSFDMKRLRDTLFVLSHSVSRLRASDFRYAPQMMAQFQFEYVLNIALAVEVKTQYREEALALYQDWRQVLADSPDQAVRLLAGLTNLLGIRWMGELLHRLKILRRRWKRGSQKRGIKG